MNEEHTLRLLDIRARLQSSFSRKSEFEKDCAALDAAIAALGGVEKKRAAPKFTYGHCENHKQAGGCQLHNLHCGYPDCDRRPAPPSKEE